MIVYVFVVQDLIHSSYFEVLSLSDDKAECIARKFSANSHLDS